MYESTSIDLSKVIWTVTRLEYYGWMSEQKVPD